jgi:sulfate adenylyltransferase subunit 1
MNIVKIATAGSVDDGKSTLIGRLLYDTNSIPQDKLEELKRNSLKKGQELELALLTDGLVAEREQGITIDVAHIYFNTNKRKYIIADSPGHVEYTRNMITGTSTAQVSVILIDASKGVLEQTKRHLFIANLLGVEKVFIVINKLDIVDYSQTVFENLSNDVKELAQELKIDVSQLSFIPASSKFGVNIVNTSTEHTPWFTGKALLEQLEEFEPKTVEEKTRFNVQMVIRPDLNFRGFAGKVLSGKLTVGDEITVLPSLETAKITSILRKEEKLEAAVKNQSVVITLDREVDISRGSTLVLSNEVPEGSKQIKATFSWLTKDPLNSSAKYILQHGSNTIQTKFSSLEQITNIETLQPSEGTYEDVKLNALFTANLKTAQPLFLDNYKENKANGRFILIDTNTNNTVAVGFVG